MNDIPECDRCGSWSSRAVPPDERDIFQVPEDCEFDYLCRDCQQELNTHTPEDLSDAELIAAIMDDSHGYASPHHAANHVDAYRAGERWAYCERAMACFRADPDDFDGEARSAFNGRPPGDLHRLMERARQHWLRLSDDKREELLEFAETWKAAEDPGEISAISMAYPTLGV